MQVWQWQWCYHDWGLVEWRPVDQTGRQSAACSQYLHITVVICSSSINVNDVQWIRLAVSQLLVVNTCTSQLSSAAAALMLMTSSGSDWPSVAACSQYLHITVVICSSSINVNDVQWIRLAVSQLLVVNTCTSQLSVIIIISVIILSLVTSRAVHCL